MDPSLKRGDSFSIEGRDAWIYCNGENTINNIINILQKIYKGNRKDIQNDFFKMIKTLSEEGYLSLEQSPNPARSQIDEKAYPKRNNDAIANIIEDNFIIMDMKTSEVYSFERELDYVWDMCDGSKTINDILSATTNTDDVMFLLQILTRIGLLELGYEDT